MSIWPCNKLFALPLFSNILLSKNPLSLNYDTVSKRGIKMIWLQVNKNNVHSIAWYLRMGFRNVRSAVQDIGGGFVMDDFRMEKMISQKPHGDNSLKTRSQE